MASRVTPATAIHLAVSDHVEASASPAIVLMVVELMVIEFFGPRADQTIRHHAEDAERGLADFDSFEHFRESDRTKSSRAVFSAVSNNKLLYVANSGFPPRLINRCLNRMFHCTVAPIHNSIVAEYRGDANCTHVYNSQKIPHGIPTVGFKGRGHLWE